MKSLDVIGISVVASDGAIEIKAGPDVIKVDVDSITPVNRSRVDYAAWYILPIAMSLGKNMYVYGAGSAETVAAVSRISALWSSWMPSVFKTVQVEFSELCDDSSNRLAEGELCLYSGGADSTYSMMKLNEKRKVFDVLTIWGMDYKASDGERFKALVNKTDSVSKLFAKQRIFLRSNIYEVYGRYCIDTVGSHVSHIFALAGALFMFSERYSRMYISADYRLDQQFMVSPWGSNTPGNKLFKDGLAELVTLDDDVTRSEKMAALLDAGDEVIEGLSFCVDYNSRPENCGLCSKCMRTKLMFLAATGSVPSIFLDDAVDVNVLDKINLSKKSERVFFIDLYSSAKSSGQLVNMPYLGVMYDKVVAVDEAMNPKSSKIIRREKRKDRVIKIILSGAILFLGYLLGMAT